MGRCPQYQFDIAVCRAPRSIVCGNVDKGSAGLCAGLHVKFESPVITRRHAFDRLERLLVIGAYFPKHAVYFALWARGDTRNPAGVDHKAIADEASV